MQNLHEGKLDQNTYGMNGIIRVWSHFCQLNTVLYCGKVQPRFWSSSSTAVQSHQTPCKYWKIFSTWLVDRYRWFTQRPDDIHRIIILIHIRKSKYAFIPYVLFGIHAHDLSNTKNNHTIFGDQKYLPTWMDYIINAQIFSYTKASFVTF